MICKYRAYEYTHTHTCDTIAYIYIYIYMIRSKQQHTCMHSNLKFYVNQSELINFN